MATTQITIMMYASHATPDMIAMLVDDNDTDNLISKRIIELSGFAGQVLVRNSGKAALEFLQANATRPNTLPDVIFLDINMPIVDGFVFLYEFEKFAATLPKEVRIVVLSSSDSRQDMERMELHPRVMRFVTKPLSTAALRELNAAVA